MRRKLSVCYPASAASSNTSRPGQIQRRAHEFQPFPAGPRMCVPSTARCLHAMAGAHLESTSCKIPATCAPCPTGDQHLFSWRTGPAWHMRLTNATSGCPQQAEGNKTRIPSISGLPCAEMLVAAAGRERGPPTPPPPSSWRHIRTGKRFQCAFDVASAREHIHDVRMQAIGVAGIRWDAVLHINAHAERHGESAPQKLRRQNWRGMHTGKVRAWAKLRETRQVEEEPWTMPSCSVDMEHFRPYSSLWDGVFAT